MSKLPRGIRNNNPGNIEKGTKWKGLAAVQSDSRFCTFTSAEYGIRAMASILFTYANKHKVTTIDAIIHRWAPAVENNTDAYIKSVEKATGVNRYIPYPIKDISKMTALMKAIIQHENGVQPYTDEVIKDGLKLTGNY